MVQLPFVRGDVNHVSLRIGKRKLRGRERLLVLRPAESCTSHAISDNDTCSRRSDRSAGEDLNGRTRVRCRVELATDTCGGASRADGTAIAHLVHLVHCRQHRVRRHERAIDDRKWLFNEVSQRLPLFVQ